MRPIKITEDFYLENPQLKAFFETSNKTESQWFNEISALDEGYFFAFDDGEDAAGVELLSPLMLCAMENMPTHASMILHFQGQNAVKEYDVDTLLTLAVERGHVETLNVLLCYTLFQNELVTQGVRLAERLYEIATTIDANQKQPYLNTFAALLAYPSTFEALASDHRFKPYLYAFSKDYIAACVVAQVHPQDLNQSYLNVIKSFLEQYKYEALIQTTNRLLERCQVSDASILSQNSFFSKRSPVERDDFPSLSGEALLLERSYRDNLAQSDSEIQYL